MTARNEVKTTKEFVGELFIIFDNQYFMNEKRHGGYKHSIARKIFSSNF